MSIAGDIGFYLLMLCCLVSLYGCLSALAAAHWRHRRLYRSSKYALTVVACMATIASLILWYLLFNRDYSVAYIFNNSSNDLPRMYTITAFWSSLEGSHLLWTLLTAIFAAVAIWTHAQDNEHIMPYVSATLQAVLCWMFYLAITNSDPFVRIFPPHPNGVGMNALLQNPYMAIHPPSLFVGYTATTIPFAYALGALAYGDITEGWLKTVRRWTLFGWIFLTAAIFLGGRWAYVELGWAGYWAWDPVENSSFLPWLLGTALLHSLLVQDKLGHLKRLSLLLAIFAFFMCFFGTFITRSGVASSVHSFASSPIGPDYLKYLAGVLLISLLVYAYRAQGILPANSQKIWGVSKESALVVTQFLLLTFTAIVFIGTLFPIVSEWFTGQKISVQAPYFNAFAPYIGLGFILAIAIGNLMRFQKSQIPNGTKIMVIAFVTAIPLTVLVAIFGDIMRTPKPFALAAQLIGVYLVFWSMACLTADFWGRLKDTRFKVKVFFQRNLAYIGAYVAHIGVLVAIIGFLGNYRGLEKQATVRSGGAAELYGYQFNFDQITPVQDANATLFTAPLRVEREGREVATMHPARSKYPTKPELLHEIAVHGTFWHDIYVVLADFDKSDGKTATLQIHINPTVRVVWISVFLMCIGGTLALFDRYRGNRSRDVVGGAWERGAHV